MIIGYARVSTPEQILEPQIEDLKNAGCEKVFSDVISGGKKARPGLTAAMDQLREGDVLMVTNIDRIGRNISDFVHLMEKLDAMKIVFRSLKQNMDSSSAMGRMFMSMLMILAEFERALIRERTQVTLAYKRARGKKGGRPRVDAQKVAMAKELYAQGIYAIRDICKKLDIGTTTFYRYIDRKAQGDPATTTER